MARDGEDPPERPVGRRRRSRRRGGRRGQRGDPRHPGGRGNAEIGCPGGDPALSRPDPWSARQPPAVAPHRSQNVMSSTGGRAAGLKSSPIVCATANRATCVTVSGMPRSSAASASRMRCSVVHVDPRPLCPQRQQEAPRCRQDRAVGGGRHHRRRTVEAALDAGDDHDRHPVQDLGQVVGALVHPSGLVVGLGGGGLLEIGEAALPVEPGQLGAAVSASVTTIQRQLCALLPVGACTANRRQSRMTSGSTGRSRSSRRRTARVVASSRSVSARSNTRSLSSGTPVETLRRAAHPKLTHMSDSRGPRWST